MTGLISENVSERDDADVQSVFDMWVEILSEAGLDSDQSELTARKLFGKIDWKIKSDLPGEIITVAEETIKNDELLDRIDGQSPSLKDQLLLELIAGLDGVQRGPRFANKRNDLDRSLDREKWEKLYDSDVEDHNSKQTLDKLSEFTPGNHEQLGEDDILVAKPGRGLEDTPSEKEQDSDKQSETDRSEKQARAEEESDTENKSDNSNNNDIIEAGP
jgi:hypothetical protein